MTETSSGTHWEREDWCKLADRLLDAAMAQAAPRACTDRYAG